MQLEMSFAVTVCPELILYSLNATAISIYKTKNLHAFSDNPIAIIVYLKETPCRGSPFRPPLQRLTSDDVRDFFEGVGAAVAEGEVSGEGYVGD